MNYLHRMLNNLKNVSHCWPECSSRRRMLSGQWTLCLCQFAVDIIYSSSSLHYLSRLFAHIIWFHFEDDDDADDDDDDDKKEWQGMSVRTPLVSPLPDISFTYISHLVTHRSRSLSSWCLYIVATFVYHRQDRPADRRQQKDKHKYSFD